MNEKQIIKIKCKDIVYIKCSPKDLSMGDIFEYCDVLYLKISSKEEEKIKGFNIKNKHHSVFYEDQTVYKCKNVEIYYNLEKY